MHALLPGHDAGAPDEAGAEGGQRRRSRRARRRPVALGLRQSASGIEAEDVLATRSTLSDDAARAAGRARAAAASMMRALAWWATKQVEVVDGQPGARRAPRRVASTMRATAWR